MDQPLLLITIMIMKSDQNNVFVGCPERAGWVLDSWWENVEDAS